MIPHLIGRIPYGREGNSKRLYMTIW
jgi:hypothetical protein